MTLETYFVETHEYNGETCALDQLEYFKYESGVRDHSISPESIETLVHDTILSLSVF